MKLIQYFNQFLRDAVNLNQTRLNDLDTRVDRITNALKEAGALDGRVLDTVPQGSWAHRTIIRPAADLEFDADFLVQLTEDLDWNDNPRTYANAVWTALSTHSTYGEMSTKKDRCVRVTYANDCHIDIVTYVVLQSGREVIVNRSINQFEDTNPIGFTDWIQEKDTLTGGNLRKVIRLLKYARDHHGAFKVKSILLTTMVGNVVDNWRTYDADYYKDVPTTLLHLTEDLDAWLQQQWTKPSITDPSCPTTTFDHRWTETQWSAFKNAFHTFAELVHDAYHAETRDDSITKWQDVFGTAFPSALTASRAASTETASLSHTPKRQRAPGEVFIDEKFPVDTRYHVTIRCEIAEPRNRAERRFLRARAGRVAKQRKLVFTLVGTDTPAPYDVYWKVRNQGGEAAAKGQLRGDLNPALLEVPWVGGG
ncbi:cyclic GMP-AMP synthase DncV-like nucleotidyltransferase [Euzebya sp.]|uniref:SMODS domain-containing nucleotidyltransferase n=1 Tax=Euzebya sp. TaxID=1971409 RepID=UPI003519636E